MDLSRGKKAVRASLLTESFQKKKRTTPIQDARFWCETGLDKNGFKRKFINTEIDFRQGQFLLEYVGSLITTHEAENRSRLYSCQKKSSWPRCYMYYFPHKGKKFCIDATKETQRLAKFVNDAPLKDPKCNAKMKLMVFDDRPKLCLFALRDIACGEEIRYDYGEDERLLFWRNKVKANEPDTHEEQSEGEDFDDDPFDVERDRRLQLQSNELESSDEYDFNVSDDQDPDYQPDKSESNSMNSDEASSYFNEGTSNKNSTRQFDDSNGEVKEVSLNRNAPCQVHTYALDVLWKQENGNDVTIIGKIGPHSILKSSFYYLKNTLTDEVIDSYMSLVVKGRNVLYIDTITATNIFEGRLEKTNLLQNVFIEDYDTCMAVVNEDDGSHWVLLIILVKEKEIFYLNPLGETNSSIQNYCHRWYDFLDRRSEEGLYGGIIRPWKMSTINHQRQIDSISCGVFVLKFAEQYLTGKPLRITSSVEQTRKEIGIKLLASLESRTMVNIDGETDNSLKLVENVDEPADTRSLSGDSASDTCIMPKSEIDKSATHVCDICQRSFKKKGALTTHVKSHNKDTAYQKPRRPCPYCGILQTRLSRHIKKKHADKPAVMNIDLLPSNSKEQRAVLDQLRKDGIEIYNRKQAAYDVPSYMAERKNGVEGSLIQCSKCKGYYKRNLFYRHKKICIGDDAEVPRKVEICSRELDTRSDEEFQREILSRFHRDTVGNLCRTDDTLYVIGRRLFQVSKKKVDKDMEKRKSVMSDMRLLARVFIEFQKYLPESLTMEDMYLRENFASLERAIEDATTDQDGKLKHGVKNSLYFLLRTTVDYLVGHHTIQKNDEKVGELEIFIKTLQAHRDIVFGDAAYAIELRRLERLRVPENKVLEGDIALLRKHTLQVIDDLTSTYTFIDLHAFVLLRDALCSRITLFNARRGGEPSRLKVENFLEAKSKRWLDNERVDSLPTWERDLFKDILITYQPGKGTHLVPDLIPLDCVAGLEIMCCSDTRRRVNILQKNNYLFPNTGLSSDHVSGWNATNKMANRAGVKRPDLVNATKQRHRISTLYSALDIPEEDRHYFYKHMGHSKEVNWGTYQHPLPVIAVTKFGKRLQDIDKGTSEQTNVPNSRCRVNDTTHPEVEDARMEQDVSKQATWLDSCNTEEQDDAGEGDISHKKDTEKKSKTKSDSIKCRNYFRWGTKETQTVKRAFKHWIEMPEGNTLPSTQHLRNYIEENQCEYSVNKLRTKIMNEQNKCQRLVKKRMKNMSDRK